MAKTIEVLLRDEMDAEVHDAVRDGEFASVNEAVQTALDEWRASRMIASVGTVELRRLWDEGLAGGKGSGLSIDEIKQAAKRGADAE